MKYLVTFSPTAKEKFIIRINKIKIHDDKLMEFSNEKIGKLVELFLDTSKIYSKYDTKNDKGEYITIHRDESYPLHFPSAVHLWIELDKIKDNDINVAYIQDFPSDESAHLFALATL